ncbi:dsRNA-binding motif domain-containing protein [Mastigocladopsis repens]|uniref:hypothetical protein n=1 Tax=Mastigocladopsis repens TaxID=221287 RepID=UPI00037F8A92|nr:hypothetical protein [Mastigocladopsis repens]
MPRKLEGSAEQYGKRTFYDESKEYTSLCLTPTALSLLHEKAAKFGLSRSEFVERIARGRIPVFLASKIALVERLIAQLTAIARNQLVSNKSQIARHEQEINRLIAANEHLEAIVGELEEMLKKIKEEETNIF